MTIREIRAADRAGIEDMLVACHAFSDEEVHVALEIVDESIATGPGRFYHTFVGCEGDNVIGYVCAAPTPLTRSTWHVYWLCVHPNGQRRGIATALQKYTEDFIRSQGGKRVVVETSGRADYSGTRTFYESAGYLPAGRIPDYYKPGDDWVVLWKPL